ncbi:MAG: 2'-5' RNA ligase family protein [Erythrobacter sp.]|uniref:2'-5' RNA ligase family protein n=1 Tax=Erythrobacter sp. TaxID=1042 RepID=UPI003297573D
MTAALPPEIQGWADALRREHYPPERNHLHAHVTMFHSFAPSLYEELKGFLPIVTREFAAPEACITGIMDLGKGTAIALQSEPLLALRSLIAEHFHGSLTAQDLHDPRPHITIQNKVTKVEARALQAQLAPAIETRTFAFPALELHLYQNGPWEHIKTCAFRGSERL